MKTESKITKKLSVIEMLNIKGGNRKTVTDITANTYDGLNDKTV